MSYVLLIPAVLCRAVEPLPRRASSAQRPRGVFLGCAAALLVVLTASPPSKEVVVVVEHRAAAAEQKR